MLNEIYEPAEERRMRAEYLIKHGLTPKRLEQAVFEGKKAVMGLEKEFGLEFSDIQELRKRWGIAPLTTKDYRHKAKTRAAA